MSLMDPEYAVREPIHASLGPTARDKTYTEPSQTHLRQDSYDEAIYAEFYEPLEEQRQQQQQEQGANGSSKSSKSTSTMEESNLKQAAADAASTHTTPAESATQTHSAPPLPQKNVLRASRMLDALNIMKLGGPGGALESHADLGRATPHDMYLSSEEDASSSADDGSDYDWESGSEYDAVDDAASASSSSSPATGRRSHEIRARVVSVVFAGKPAIIDLSSPTTSTRRSPNHSTSSINTTSSVAAAAVVPIPMTTSPVSMTASASASSASLASSTSAATSSSSSRRRSESSSAAAAAPVNRLSVSSTSSSIAPTPTTASPTTAVQHPPRQSSMLAALLTKQKRTPPPFLSIDPYANGSTYSLDVQQPAAQSSPPRQTASPVQAGGEETPTPTPAPSNNNHTSPPKTPRTPTAVLKDFSRTFGALSRKRSKPVLITSGGSISSPVAFSPMSATSLATVGTPDATERTSTSMDFSPITASRQRTSTMPAAAPATPVENSNNNRRVSQEVVTAASSPTPKSGGGKLFGGFSARRRSIKLSAGKLLQ